VSYHGKALPQYDRANLHDLVIEISNRARQVMESLAEENVLVGRERVAVVQPTRVSLEQLLDPTLLAGTSQVPVGHQPRPPRQRLATLSKQPRRGAGHLHEPVLRATDREGPGHQFSYLNTVVGTQQPTDAQLAHAPQSRLLCLPSHASMRCCSWRAVFCSCCGCWFCCCSCSAGAD
jgi:hypothetical protein